MYFQQPLRSVPECLFRVARGTATGLLLLVGVTAGADTLPPAPALTLDSAVQQAISRDPWLQANQHSQAALQAASVAAGQLPDPTVSLGVQNLAADTFDLNQEPMTQLRVGLTQMLPRGDSLDLKQRQMQELADQYPYQRQDRRARVRVQVAQLWLDAYKARASIALIEKSRTLFDQLVDVSQASYSSTVGKTRQQDVVRAQLELTRLQDRLLMLQQQQETAQATLAQWLVGGNGFRPGASDQAGPASAIGFVIADDLPRTRLLHPEQVTDSGTDPGTLSALLEEHPAVQALERKIAAGATGIRLAKQKYRPQWGLNLGYGYRDEDPMGNKRADLFSVGVSFDLPLFTANRQDQEVKAAVSGNEAGKSEKWLLLRDLMSAFDAARVRLLRLDQRQALYQGRLLRQSHEQAEAALTAYTRDDGDFAEVVRARIAELNAEIDALDIAVERQKSIFQLNYFFTRSQAEAPAQTSGDAA